MLFRAPSGHVSQQPGRLAWASTLSRPKAAWRNPRVVESPTCCAEQKDTALENQIIKQLTIVNVPLERDIFFRSLLRELSGTLEQVVGVRDASGFVSVVGQNIGDNINSQYKAALNTSRLSREQVTAVLVDLKRRIEGDFYVIEESDEKIVLGNRACPFGDKVHERQSLCMMTSNVFGAIAADNLGYAKVSLEKTIAAGDNECRVVIYLRPCDETERADGREYFKS